MRRPAESILIVRDARIAGHGTHRDLMRSDGYYAQLVNRQTRGLLPAT